MRSIEIVEIRVVLYRIIPNGIIQSNSTVIHPPSSIFNAYTELKFGKDGTKYVILSHDCMGESNSPITSNIHSILIEL
jgi:hypothetical protein